VRVKAASPVQFKGDMHKMETGNLVQRLEDGAFGIVLGTHESEAEVMFGDGLREIVPSNSFVIVPFKLGVGFPASFPEMVEAFLTLRGF